MVNKNYTGEGFKNEKLLALTAVVFTIVSSLFLMNLTLLQRKHVKLQIKDLEKNGNK
jgi:hypothetical protein